MAWSPGRRTSAGAVARRLLGAKVDGRVAVRVADALLAFDRDRI
ncbi:hypothetical protein [Nocardioides sp. NPDC006273]